MERFIVVQDEYGYDIVDTLDDSIWTHYNYDTYHLAKTECAALNTIVQQERDEFKEVHQFLQSIINAAFKCALDPDEFAAQSTELLEKYWE